MHVLFKLGLLFLCFAVSRSEEEVLKCNLRYCGAELLTFEKFTLGGLFRKMELASFCVKNCTPPVVHEFFQSIIFSITKRIPGHCSGAECVDKNRFVALAQCVEHQAWPLLQCSKNLLNLAHIKLVENPAEKKRNTTCEIVTEAAQCIEETLQNCGDAPFQLVKEILGDLIRLGINAYCHPSYRDQGWFMKRTTALTRDPSLPTSSPLTEGPGYKHPQYVKGYRPDSAPGFSHVSHIFMLMSAVFGIMYIHYYH